MSATFDTAPETSAPTFVDGIPCRIYDTVVVGAGCAGLAVADSLHRLGRKSLAVIADYSGGGTSRNTGSDKQTYYKLTLCGDDSDSVRKMAETLHGGGCMDGDHALAEAALSVPCFSRLCDLGVQFPQNRYGEYVGYKTDHDPMRRATSAGPLTSRMMAHALESAVKAQRTEMLAGRHAVKVLVADGVAKGVACLHVHEGKPGLEIFLCNHLVFATGGPAGIYHDSAYPAVHTGSSGILFEAGARGKNLTEWQYGLASLRPRWNVSGTYMQAIPRFVSTDQDGNGEREFLPDYIDDAGSLMNLVFMKGYQWPFDIRKAKDGSSLIDLMVYTETKIKGRRVFLDFTRNPFSSAFASEKLGREAYAYLEQAGALFGTPIDRLAHMNSPAVDFYLGHGIDLRRDKLEIALCAQHQNGGIDVDMWWRSSIDGLFVVGEAAGTHGIYRPGGSALNSGQVGARRAAAYIARQNMPLPDPVKTLAELRRDIDWIRGVLSRPPAEAGNLDETVEHFRKRMSGAGAAIRNAAEIDGLLREVKDTLFNFEEAVRISSVRELPRWFRCRDMLYAQWVTLSAMADYIGVVSRSRGSALYSDVVGDKPLTTLPDMFRFSAAHAEDMDKVQECRIAKDEVETSWRRARPLPSESYVFETVWREYRDGVIFS